MSNSNSNDGINNDVTVIDLCDDSSSSDDDDDDVVIVKRTIPARRHRPLSLPRPLPPKRQKRLSTSSSSILRPAGNGDVIELLSSDDDEDDDYDDKEEEFEASSRTEHRERQRNNKPAAAAKMTHLPPARLVSNSNLGEEKQALKPPPQKFRRPSSSSSSSSSSGPTSNNHRQSILRTSSQTSSSVGVQQQQRQQQRNSSPAATTATTTVAAAKYNGVHCHRQRQRQQERSSPAAAAAAATTTNSRDAAGLNHQNGKSAGEVMKEALMGLDQELWEVRPEHCWRLVIADKIYKSRDPITNEYPYGILKKVYADVSNLVGMDVKSLESTIKQTSVQYHINEFEKYRTKWGLDPPGIPSIPKDKSLLLRLKQNFEQQHRRNGVASSAPPAEAPIAAAAGVVSVNSSGPVTAALIASSEKGEVGHRREDSAVEKKIQELTTATTVEKKQAATSVVQQRRGEDYHENDCKKRTPVAEPKIGTIAAAATTTAAGAGSSNRLKYKGHTRQLSMKATRFGSRLRILPDSSSRSRSMEEANGDLDDDHKKNIDDDYFDDIAISSSDDREGDDDHPVGDFIQRKDQPGNKLEMESTQKQSNRTGTSRRGVSHISAVNAERQPQQSHIPSSTSAVATTTATKANMSGHRRGGSPFACSRYGSIIQSWSTKFQAAKTRFERDAIAYQVQSQIWKLNLPIHRSLDYPAFCEKVRRSLRTTKAPTTGTATTVDATGPSTTLSDSNTNSTDTTTLSGLNTKSTDTDDRKDKGDNGHLSPSTLPSVSISTSSSSPTPGFDDDMTFTGTESECDDLDLDSSPTDSSDVVEREETQGASHNSKTSSKATTKTTIMNDETTTAKKKKKKKRTIVQSNGHSESFSMTIQERVKSRRRDPPVDTLRVQAPADATKPLATAASNVADQSKSSSATKKKAKKAKYLTIVPGFPKESFDPETKMPVLRIAVYDNKNYSKCLFTIVSSNIESKTDL